ncbi:hypothetical protein HY967_01630 [Candidatus Jorgensenbacteria bacterium]|nr:hypothetical protein [Candidatus Jorgensenbacteria bacterium]
MRIEFIYNDGGCSEAGYKGQTGDCVVRAIAIATEKPYQEVYDAINAVAKGARAGSRKGKPNARNGARKQTYRPYLESIGWQWVPTMQIGQGCKTHLKADELPAGRLIVALSKHLVAVINGVVHDTFLDDRGGTRCVYGYFTKV